MMKRNIGFIVRGLDAIHRVRILINKLAAKNLIESVDFLDLSQLDLLFD